MLSMVNVQHTNSDARGSQPDRLCIDGSSEGVPECCSGARARKERKHYRYLERGVPPGACYAKPQPHQTTFAAGVSVSRLTLAATSLLYSR